MKKLIKTTALFTFIFLFYCTSFGGGWQKNLSEILDGYNTGSGINNGTSYNYLPTKDGGILVYGYSNGTLNDINGYLIKLDKYGNIQWHKDVIKSNYSILIDTSSYFYHEGGIQSVVETENGDFVLMHNGPTFYGNALTLLYDHRKIRYFTRINNYGAIISTKFDLMDSVTLDKFAFPTYTANKFDINNNTYSVYSIIHSNYVANKSILMIKTYDSSFNLLTSKYVTLDSVSNRYYLSYIDVKDSIIFICDFGQQTISQIYWTDLQGNTIFKKLFNVDTIIKYTFDSIRQLHSTCLCNPDANENIYNFKDYFFDNLGNLHLFSIITMYQEPIVFGDTTCKRAGAYYYLSEFILDRNGRIVKINTLDLESVFNPFDGLFGYNLIAMPQQNGKTNLLILPSNISFEKYYFIQYDSQNNSIVKKNIFSNLTDTKSFTLFYPNTLFSAKV